MLLIKNGTILTMTGENIKNGELLIKDNKILKVGKNLNIDGDCEVIDVKGAYVTPGFIDAHTHIGMFEESVGWAGEDGNEVTDPVTPQLRAIDAINPMDTAFKEAYEHGITCVCTGPGSANVIGGTFAVIKTKGKRIDNMIVKKNAAMKCAFGENPKRCYGKDKKSPATRMATAAILRETLMKAREYLNKKQNGDNPNFDIKMESLIPVLKREIPLKVHAHRADDIFTAIRIGKEFNLKLTLDHCTEGHLIADELKKEGYPAIIGPTLTYKSKIEVKNKTFKTYKALSDAGLKIAIMTDCPVIPEHYLPLCAALAVKDGLDEETALKSITINAAEILGIQDRVGSIEEGKDADIVVFDRHPLDIMAKTQHVFIDGKRVK